MNEPEVLPPWNLTGYGYIFVYRFKKAFLETLSCLDRQAVIKKHNFGSVMLVNYHDSEAGPYKELLFIPGMVLPFRSLRYFTISKIYVSTMNSVVNGRKNWGIPKEQADFIFEEAAGNTERISVSANGKVFFEATVKASKFPFYVNSGFIPIKLMQRYENKYYKVPLKGKGVIYPAYIKDIKVDQDNFPDVSGLRPCMSFKVKNFKLKFEKADIFLK